MTRLCGSAVLLVGLATSCFAQDTAAVQVKITAGAPFSAEAVNESTQVLGDGNQIVHKNSALIARDSEGRTRREQKLSNGASIVFLQDPAAGFAYVIDPKTKSARRFAISTIGSKAEESALGNNGDLLGSQVIEGVQVDGTRVTHTVAAGADGNQRYLVVTIEAWYSSELQTVIMRKTTDPRTGESVYKLTNIQRGEPDHSLFEIPQGYTIRDGHLPAALGLASQ